MKLWLIPAFLLILIFSVSAIALANVSVGVKQGDWVEYNVTFTGSPPIEHDAVWAKMEIINVDGAKVNATFVSRLANGSTLNVQEDLDFETGRLIDMFVVPSGLEVGDTFYDKTVGNVTINRVEVRSYSGTSRTVIYAEVLDTQWFWDKISGVTLEARTANSVYTLNTIAVNTNIWSPRILGLDPIVLYVLMILVVIGILCVAIVFLVRRKQRLNRENLREA